MDMLRRNLDFLETYNPELFHKVINVRPENILPSNTIDNDITIDGESFYGTDGHVACRAQVDQFFARPSHYTLTYTSDDLSRYSHQKVINRLNEKVLDLGYKKSGKPSITSLIALGSGLGFYIDFIMQVQELCHLILVEPDDEMLLQFLHHADLDQLSEHCKKNGGSLCIIQPHSCQEFSEMIRHIADDTGYSLFSELSVYRHYETPLFDEIMLNFKEMRSAWLSAWGFFDDEIMGLSHSIKNTRLQPFLINTDKKNDLNCQLPAVVVGCGPSLDKDIELLKSRQHEFIIISCASAIAPLINYGIKPDFHAEMERSELSEEVQLDWFGEEFCKSTVLLALNTVSPEITRRFNNAVLFPKTQDIGTIVMDKSCGQPLTSLSLCNPTVTNFAASAAVSLGFDSIVLLGCDYGFRSDKSHHSRSSDYYNKESVLSDFDFGSDFEVPDNHGGYISTTRIYNQSRKQMEMLINKNPDVEFYNCADGARIVGSQWLTLSEMLGGNSDKKDIFSLILENARVANLELCSEELKSVFDFYSEKITFMQSILNKKYPVFHVNNVMSELISWLDGKQYKERPDILISGNVKYIAVCIAGHIARITPQARDEYCNYAMHLMNEMFENSISTLNTLTKDVKV